MKIVFFKFFSIATVWGAATAAAVFHAAAAERRYVYAV